jgi:hypothetical protein
MVGVSSPHIYRFRNALQKPTSVQRRRRKAALITALAATATALVLAGSSPSAKIPKHTSILTGQQWVNELLNGHPDRIREGLGMSKEIFRQLLKCLRQRCCLRSSRGISDAEQLAIFLHMAVVGASNRQLQERFQRSGDTISR